MTTHFRSGPAFGLSAEVKSKLAHKYDPQKEEELRLWIHEVTGRKVPDNFMEGLKDGVILCELINKLQPGSVKKINNSPQNWHQLENIGNFVKAITDYGLKPHDVFEANDLFENVNHTQVQSTLITLAGMAKSKGFQCKYDIGVKYAEKQQRRFNPEKLKEGRNIIGLQMGTNKFASQKGMTSYGTRRHLYDPKTGMESPMDQSTISLQMGTNKGANQSGMTAPGTKRQIFDKKLDLEPCDTSTVSLQMGTNKVASQMGMTVYGLPRQVYDSKYCVNPETLFNNGEGGGQYAYDNYQNYSD
ncbi:calponin-1-like isoform X1 [Brienomyrus brachyistius]|uniref:calponin-1-like isoform X1 n=1 Tax=Brienomyrus brachyistius TaxID=42636 RepID=UPI0020B1ED18|nr:calponin-1-like isoform X1 [Brienomyrus brachyistius]